MSRYIEQHSKVCGYDDYLRSKVEAARKQRAVGLHFSNEEVEAEANARRAKLLRCVVEI